MIMCSASFASGRLGANPPSSPTAASELYDKERKEYVFPGEAKMNGHRVARSTEEMIDYYEELAGEFQLFLLKIRLMKKTGKVGSF